MLLGLRGGFAATLASKILTNSLSSTPPAKFATFPRGDFGDAAATGSAALTGDRASGPRDLASGSKPARPRHLALLRRALRGRKVDELSAWRRRGILCGRVLVV